MANLTQITCPECGTLARKPASHVNRSRKTGAPVFCGPDCAAKGRIASRKYDAPAFRAAWHSDTALADIARAYGVSVQTVWRAGVRRFGHRTFLRHREAA